MIAEFVIAEGEKAKRLDAFLVQHERGVSRTGLQRLIASGRIRVNAAVVKSSRKIQPGDRITIDQPEPGPVLVNSVPVPLEILYEDMDLLVINKPSGVVSHPTSGHWHGTLLNGLLHHFQSNSKRDCLQLQGYPGLVHRLDKDTSGVMVVAKNSEAHRDLCLQFERHSIIRIYEALVHGNLKAKQGTITLAIGRDALDGKKVSSNTSVPQTAATHYRVIRQFGTLVSLVELTPYSGRQHQLRVHMASLGCPIVGDLHYGLQNVTLPQRLVVPRMMLHARMLRFRHPISLKWKEFSSSCPPEMTEFAARAEFMSKQII